MCWSTNLSTSQLHNEIILARIGKFQKLCVAPDGSSSLLIQIVHLNVLADLLFISELHAINSGYIQKRKTVDVSFNDTQSC